MAYINKINVDGVEYEVQDPNSATKATFDPDTGIVSFKNSSGKLLFELDLSEIANVVYGDMSISVTELTVAEGGSGTFTIQLAVAPSGTQPVYLAVSDNSKLSVEPAALSFNSNNWNVPQTVTVTALQDEDQYDEDVSVTATSKKVEAKVIAITVSDDDKPSVVTDGLCFNLDYIDQAENTTDVIVDTVNGVSVTNFSYFTKVSNGVYGTNVQKPLTATVSGPEWEAFIADMKAGTGATLEIFCLQMYPTFVTGAGTLMQPGANYGFSVGAVPVGSFSTSMQAKLSDDTTAKPGSINYTFTIDGVQYKPSNNGAHTSKLPYYDKFIHIVFTFSESGVFSIYVNGLKLDTEVAVENFVSWDIDASFATKLDMYRVYAVKETSVYSAQRIYNRALTADEITKNMKYNATKMGLSTF